MRMTGYVSKVACVVIGMCGLAVGTYGQTLHTWKGGSGDWSDPDQWTNGVPGEGAVALVCDGSVVLSEATAALNSFQMTGGTLTFTNWATQVIADDVRIAGGTITHVPNTVTAAVEGVWIPLARVAFVCGDFILENGAVIDVVGKGYPGRALVSTGGGYGPGGAPNAYTGASHGGYGGKSYPHNTWGAAPYGSTTEPETPGSGGGSDRVTNFGGNGGGVVRIDVTGNVMIDGMINANGSDGGNSYSSGGSGGSVWISGKTISGSGGQVHAAGGNAVATSNWAGSAGGGRIAVVYDPLFQCEVGTPDIACYAPNGIPGSGSVVARGTPGTLYFSDTAMLHSTPVRHEGEIHMDVTEWHADTLVISNIWVSFPAGGFQLTVTNDLLVTGSSGCLSIGGNAYWRDTVGAVEHWFHNTTEECPVMSVGGNLTITNGGGLSVNAGSIGSAPRDYGALVEVGGTLLVTAQSTLMPRSHHTNGGSALFRANGVTILTNGAIDAAACGFAGGTASTSPGYPGKSGGWPSGWGAGGGYGGMGGADLNNQNAGKTNGLPENPLSPGSGGRGYDINSGYGGGLVRIEAAGTVRIDGSILAQGEGFSTSYSGAGSGGGINIRCRTFAGNPGGVLNVNGGTGGNTGNSGGAGRIAVWRITHRYEGTTLTNPGAPIAHYAAVDQPTGSTPFWGQIPFPGTLILLR